MPASMRIFIDMKAVLNTLIFARPAHLFLNMLANSLTCILVLVLVLVQTLLKHLTLMRKVKHLRQMFSIIYLTTAITQTNTKVFLYTVKSALIGSDCFVNNVQLRLNTVNTGSL